MYLYSSIKYEYLVARVVHAIARRIQTRLTAMDGAQAGRKSHAVEPSRVFLLFLVWPQKIEEGSIRSEAVETDN